MPNGRALFSVLNPPDRRASEGKFYLATRRGKQFNSMTFGTADRLMGAKSRDIIFMSPEDAQRLELADGAAGGRPFGHRRNERHHSNRPGQVRNTASLLAGGQRSDIPSHGSGFRRAGLQRGSFVEKIIG